MATRFCEGVGKSRRMQAKGSYENARRLRIKASLIVDAPVEVEERAGIYRVWAGPWAGRSGAAAAKKRLQREGIEAVILAVQ